MTETNELSIFKKQAEVFAGLLKEVIRLSPLNFSAQLATRQSILNALESFEAEKEKLRISNE